VKTLLKHLCKTNLIHVMPFLNSDFFSKKNRVSVVAATWLFLLPKIERKIYFERIPFADFILNF